VRRQHAAVSSDRRIRDAALQILERAGAIEFEVADFQRRVQVVELRRSVGAQFLISFLGVIPA
jgi:hypothetical protein